MSELSGSHNENQSFNTLSQAIESGVRFWGTSDIYGPKTNEELFGERYPEAMMYNLDK